MIKINYLLLALICTCSSTLFTADHRSVTISTGSPSKSFLAGRSLSPHIKIGSPVARAVSAQFETPKHDDFSSHSVSPVIAITNKKKIFSPVQQELSEEQMAEFEHYIEQHVKIASIISQYRTLPTKTLENLLAECPEATLYLLHKKMRYASLFDTVLSHSPKLSSGSRHKDKSSCSCWLLCNTELRQRKYSSNSPRSHSRDFYQKPLLKNASSDDIQKKLPYSPILKKLI